MDGWMIGWWMDGWMMESRKKFLRKKESYWKRKQLFLSALCFCTLPDWYWSRTLTLSIIINRKSYIYTTSQLSCVNVAGALAQGLAPRLPWLSRGREQRERVSFIVLFVALFPFPFLSLFAVFVLYLYLVSSTCFCSILFLYLLGLKVAIFLFAKFPIFRASGECRKS